MSVGPKVAPSPVLVTKGPYQFLGSLNAGGRLRLDFDPKAMRTHLGQQVVHAAGDVAFIKGFEAEVHPVVLAHKSIVAPVAKREVAIPLWATEVRVLLKAHGKSEAVRTHVTIPIGIAAENADPTWLPNLRARPLGMPNLPGRKISVIGPSTFEYDCSDWATNIPARFGLEFPAHTLADYDFELAKLGYRPISPANPSPTHIRRLERHVPGTQKLAIYDSREKGEHVSHFAVQLPDGRWSSKLGTLHLVTLEHLDDIAHGVYGRPIRIYQRPISQF